jgi:hypothetical protein
MDSLTEDSEFDAFAQAELEARLQRFGVHCQP